MKMLRLRRGVLLLLLLSLLLPILAGCVEAQPTQPPEPTEPPSLLDQWESSLQSGEGSIAFTAKQLAGFIALSAWFNLDFVVEAGSIQCGKNVYEVITYTEDYEPKFSEMYTPQEEYDLTQLYEKIKAQKGCWFLDTADGDLGKRMVVYAIDGTYYFLSDYGNDPVMRIYYVNAVAQSLIYKLESTMKNEDGEVAFTAVPFYQIPSLSWEYALDVVVESGQVYINDILYDSITYSEDFSLEYSEGFIEMAEYKDNLGGSSIAKTLQELQNKKECYLLETDSEKNYGKVIAMFEMDGIYYFMNFLDSGEVQRIHAASAE